MRMIKLLMVMMLFAVSVLTLTGLTVRAQSATTLIVNYHCFDGAYGPWSLWLWQEAPSPGEGQNVPFNGYHPETGSRQLVYDTLS